MFSQAGFSIYHGESYTGWPKTTIRRGEVVYENKEIIAQAGTGKVIPREATQKLK